MPDTLNRIEAKLDSVREDLGEMKIVQSEQARDIQHHIKRSDLLEEDQKKLRAEFEPLKRSHLMWAGAGKVLAVLGGLAGIAKVMWEFIHP